ncbi:MAG: PaaI family thioesterase [Firmicutes bacterium]|nr:PaaI family thioesterase [Bacillota bacterium]
MRKNSKTVIYKQLPTPFSITCGPENPASLGCEFYVLEDNEVATTFVSDKIHEGQLSIMHGGLTASVLDELMGRAVMAYHDEEQRCEEVFISRYVTAEMTTKYKKPIRIGDRVYGYGSVVDHEGRKSFASAYLINEKEEILATAEGLFIEVKVKREDLTDRLIKGENRQKLSKKDPKVL